MKVCIFIIIILCFLYPAAELSRCIFLDMELYPLLRNQFIAEIIIFWILFIAGSLLVWKEIRGVK